MGHMSFDNNPQMNRVIYSPETDRFHESDVSTQRTPKKGLPYYEQKKSESSTIRYEVRDFVPPQGYKIETEESNCIVDYTVQMKHIKDDLKSTTAPIEIQYPSFASHTVIQPQYIAANN